jgi:hypothetical protein
VGYKTWANGDALTGPDLMLYLMNQVNIGCTSSTRPASPTEGMHIYETDTDKEYVYTTIGGVSAWSLSRDFAQSSAPAMWLPQVYLSTTGQTDNGKTGYWHRTNSFVQGTGTFIFGDNGITGGQASILLPLGATDVGAGAPNGRTCVGSYVVLDSTGGLIQQGNLIYNLSADARADLIGWSPSVGALFRYEVHVELNYYATT